MSFPLKIEPAPNKHYSTMALVPHKQQIPKLGSLCSPLLVVSFDYNLTFELRDLGYEAIYFESGLVDWDDQNLGSELYLRANEWVNLNGIDQTKFNEVSLGRLFARQTSYLMISYHRIRAAIYNLTKVFCPKSVALLDCKNEFGLLHEKHRLMLVQEVCLELDVQLINLFDPIHDDDDYFPQFAIYGGVGFKRTSSDYLRGVFEFACSLASRFKRREPKQRSIIVFCGGHVSRQLIFNKHPTNTEFVLFPSLFPKKHRIFRYLVKENLRFEVAPSLIATLKMLKKNKKIAQIKATYRKEWEKAESSGCERVLREFLDEEVFESNKLNFFLSLIHEIQNLLTNIKPNRVLVDSVFGPESRIVLDLCASLKIPVDYVAHGYWEHKIYFDTLCGDHLLPPRVDRVFSWGSQQERWLKAINWGGKIERVGCTIASEHVGKMEESKARKNILVLQYTPMNSDINGLNYNQYSYFEHVVKHLNESGRYAVRFKLHAGLFKVSYYETIKQRFDLQCELCQGGKFSDHLAWADEVIGPACSGARLEALAVGKPYYAIQLKPHSHFISTSVKSCFESIPELLEAFDTSFSRNHSEITEELIGLSQFPNPAQALLNKL